MPPMATTDSHEIRIPSTIGDGGDRDGDVMSDDVKADKDRCWEEKSFSRPQMLDGAKLLEEERVLDQI
ncbi:hypothetical protein L195_g046196 [Trifolium pratense]|uniref:Uncharacterized protein n=1 Tax=Trifolium pratense TaxID=57577 RepID=A0A2K3MH15_TRIPR|nr:hypothetical protein L195_g046196 [Trifolium pratense]